MNIKGVMICPHPPIIIPEVGKGREKEALDTLNGMKQLAKKVSDIKPNTIVCITPHGNVFKDAVAVINHEIISGDLAGFGEHEVTMEKRMDREIYEELVHELDKNSCPYITISDDVEQAFDIKGELDHGCLVPLYYIDQYYKEYEILHITYGLLDYGTLYKMGMYLQKVIEKLNKKVVLLASGDLSHCLMQKGPYEYHPSGQLFDNELLSIIKECNFKALFSMNKEIVEDAKECGLRSFIMGIGVLDRYKVSSEVYSYEAPFGVGYMTAFLSPESMSEYSVYEELIESRQKVYEDSLAREDAYIKLARRAINEYVKNNKRIILTDDEAKIFKDSKAGTFVSIHKNGELRGCIGTIKSTQRHIGDEIIGNAIQAAAADPRFMPIEEKELVELEIKVDVLHEIEPIQDKSELDVNKYGIVVERGLKRGLLLPRLEGINTIEKQILIALQKAGIDPKEEYKMYRFQVDRHEV